MHWSVALGTTSSENYHSQGYLYAYQWGLGSRSNYHIGLRHSTLTANLKHLWLKHNYEGLDGV